MWSWANCGDVASAYILNQIRVSCLLSEVRATGLDNRIGIKPSGIQEPVVEGTRDEGWREGGEDGQSSGSLGPVPLVPPGV